MGVLAVEMFDRYLGLPTNIGRSKTQIFDFVKIEFGRNSRVRKRDHFPEWTKRYS